MEAWYRDPAARAFVLLRFLPWFAALNLAWEAAHVPLYTLWEEAQAGYIVFSVVHCTLGDLAIGTAALLIALVVTRSQRFTLWKWPRIALLTIVAGAGYTIFSEWVNVSRQSWQYSELMPVLRAFGVEIGISPVAQWLVLPPLALWLARRWAPALRPVARPVRNQ